ncbi:MAG: hypothetical protein IPP90_22410 [Gemmatimonadaceae bacterium]|nr:hypothetical protein [Gemmatimonadaceae bacterium]
MSTSKSPIWSSRKASRTAVRTTRVLSAIRRAPCRSASTAPAMARADSLTVVLARACNTPRMVIHEATPKTLNSSASTLAFQSVSRSRIETRTGVDRPLLIP